MSLQKIKVSRENVLNIVQDNKEKHDLILKGAIEGYWMDAESFLKKTEKEIVDGINKNHKNQLKQLRKVRKESLKALKTNIKKDFEAVAKRDRTKGFTYWQGKYPEDHGDDYLGTIRRLELSVDNEIELETNEFDSYIRNKWTWRDQFLSANKGYVTSYCGTGSYAASSSWAASACSGSYIAF